MDKKYSIKVISNSCGILPHTLRVWEQRYQVFRPERSDSGQRIYTEKDMRKAVLLAKLLGQGHTISHLANHSIGELEGMIQVSDSPEVKPKLGHSLNTKNLLKYLSEYKLQNIADEVSHLRMSVGAREFVFEIVLPILREIGLMVAKGKYTVTQEHIISTIIREQLNQIYLPNLGPKNKEIALATPDGNLHELSIIIADILCRANRLTTRYLGAAHPAEFLGTALNALKTPYLVLGAVSSDQWNYEKNIIPYLQKIDKFLDREITVLIGGGKIVFPEFKNIKEVKVIPTLEEFDRLLKII